MDPAIRRLGHWSVVEPFQGFDQKLGYHSRAKDTASVSTEIATWQPRKLSITSRILLVRRTKPLSRRDRAMEGISSSLKNCEIQPTKWGIPSSS
ncbi:hypothetical protein GEMRC1_006137 [Eukaryota sp. GEM-RC1]